jgi:uncharacterized protein YdhG (YjbR/CyaY superfamily)
MASAESKPMTIDEYLVGLKADQRFALEKVRRVIHDVVPKAEECSSYGIPVLRLNGRSLVFFAAWANHCAFYRGRSAVLKRFRNELRNFQTSKGTIRFFPANHAPLFGEEAG